MAISPKENFIVGLRDFWARKIRSFITILGIILGTMSIIVVMSLVQSINKITKDFMLQRGGLKKISINKNYEYQKKKEVREYFTYNEFNKIRGLIPNLEYISATIRSYGKTTSKQNVYWGPVFGVLPSFKHTEEWDTSNGRFISDFDEEQSHSVIVLGHNVAKELFGMKNPVGKIVSYRDKRLKVIGVMRYRYFKNGQNIGNDNQLDYLNRRCFIPLSTMIHKINAKDRISTFSLTVLNIKDVQPTTDFIKNLLLNIRQGEHVFQIQTAQESIEQSKNGLKIFSLIFGLISAISLLVGGIVIMNIMLATVQERTREIGVRLAVGARRSDIFFQFLIQTILTTLIGGLIGVAISFSLLSFIGGFLDMPLKPGLSMVFVSLFVSGSVGLIFGIGPAIKASRLDPVTALRYE
jgi:putative ABC transport system permease protein